MERRAIEPTAWGTELGWYRETRLSPAVQVGDLLFVAGCTGASAAADGPRAQMRRACEEIGEVLEAAGASWDEVVSMTTYHVHFRRDIEEMTEVHREFVTKEPPGLDRCGSHRALRAGGDRRDRGHRARVPP